MRLPGLSAGYEKTSPPPHVARGVDLGKQNDVTTRRLTTSEMRWMASTPFASLPACTLYTSTLSVHAGAGHERPWHAAINTQGATQSKVFFTPKR